MRTCRRNAALFVRSCRNRAVPPYPRYSSFAWQPARSLFHFGRLHWDDLAVCAAVGVLSLVLLEALKSRWFRVTAAAASEPSQGAA